MVGAELLQLCIHAMTMIANERAPAQTAAYRHALSHNICVAAQHARIEPSILIALILTENDRLITTQIGPAVQGVDVGLCQINTVAHPEFTRKSNPAHPFDCGVYAANILKKAFSIYGDDWRAIAHYWSPRQAKQQTDGAKQYFMRWNRFHDYTLIKFSFAKAKLNAEMALSQPQ
jgi:fatty-acid desaturase